LRDLEPDLVIFYQGWNDLKYMRSLAGGGEVDHYFAVRDLSRYKFLTARPPLRNWYALREMVGFPLQDPDPLGEGDGALFGAIGDLPTSGSQEGDPEDIRTQWSASPGMRFWRNNVETLVWRMIQDGVVPVLVAQNTLVTADPNPDTRDKIRYDLVGLEHQDIVVLNDLMAEALADIAERFNIPFIDLRSTFNGRTDIFADHIHLRPGGSQQLAVALARELVPVLERWSNRTGDGGVIASAVARWRFEDSRSLKNSERRVQDSGPHGLHGRLEAGVSSVPGFLGNGYGFDGTTGQIVIPTDRVLDLTRNFRIEARVNLNGVTPKQSQGLVVKAGAYHLAIRGGRPAFFGYDLEPQTWFSGRTPIPPQGWHHIVVEYVGDEVTILLDGDIVLRKSATGEVKRSTRPLILGGGAGFFRGRMDEVGLFIRVEPEVTGSRLEP
jgi:hypothetical protein